MVTKKQSRKVTKDSSPVITATILESNVVPATGS